MKKNALAAGLRAAAGKPQPNTADAAASSSPAIHGRTLPASVLIGGHFSPEVRRTLLLVQAERENAGKNLRQLLGEAINDLCVKYGKPQPYGEGD